MPPEYNDFLLMREIYHCPPSVFHEQDSLDIEMHKMFLYLEAKTQKKKDRGADFFKN